MEAARFTLVTVLPSPALALVTMMLWWSSSATTTSRLERSTRNASARIVSSTVPAKPGALATRRLQVARWLDGVRWQHADRATGRRCREQRDDAEHRQAEVALEVLGAA